MKFTFLLILNLFFTNLSFALNFDKKFLLGNSPFALRHQIKKAVQLRGIDKCNEWGTLAPLLDQDSVPYYELKNWLITLSQFSSREGCERFDLFLKWIKESNENLKRLDFHLRLLKTFGKTGPFRTLAMPHLPVLHMMENVNELRPIRNRLEFLLALQNLISYKKEALSSVIRDHFNSLKKEAIEKSEKLSPPAGQEKVRRLSSKEKYEFSRLAVSHAIQQVIIKDAVAGGLFDNDKELESFSKLANTWIQEDPKDSETVEQVYKSFSIEKQADVISPYITKFIAQLIFPFYFEEASFITFETSPFNDPSVRKHFLEEGRTMRAQFLVKEDQPLALSLLIPPDERGRPAYENLNVPDVRHNMINIIKLYANTGYIFWKSGISALVYHMVKHPVEDLTKENIFTAVEKITAKKYYEEAMQVIIKAEPDTVILKSQESESSKLLGQAFFCVPSRAGKVKRAIINMMDLSDEMILDQPPTYLGAVPVLVTFQDDLKSCE